MCDTLTQQFRKLEDQRGMTHASLCLGTLLTVGAYVLTEVVFHVSQTVVIMLPDLALKEGGSTCKERGVRELENEE